MFTESPKAPFTRNDARAAGFTPAQIRHRLDSGQWTRVGRGVYLLQGADGERSPREELLAACSAALLLHPDTVISHTTAARLWGMPAPRTDSFVHLSRADGRPRTPSRVNDRVIHTAEHVGPTQVVDGLAVTSAARTVVDVARRHHKIDGLIAADHALRQQLTDSPRLHAVLEGQRGWPWIKRARSVVELASPLSESPGESLSRWFFDAAGLPMPEQQVVIQLPDGTHARVDFLWRDCHVVGEFDGMVKYADPSALRAEKLRQEALEELGYVVVRWTWNDLVRAAVATEARIRRALTRRARRHRRSAAPTQLLLSRANAADSAATPWVQAEWERGGQTKI